MAVPLGHPKVLRFPVPEVFAAVLPGQRVDAVTRRGKFILCALHGGEDLVVPPRHDRPPAGVRRRRAGAAAHPPARARSTTAASCATTTPAASAGSCWARARCSRIRACCPRSASNRCPRSSPPPALRRRPPLHDAHGQGGAARPARRRRAGQHLHRRGVPPRRGAPAAALPHPDARPAGRAARRHPRGAALGDPQPGQQHRRLPRPLERQGQQPGTAAGVRARRSALLPLRLRRCARRLSPGAPPCGAHRCQQ